MMPLSFNMRCLNIRVTSLLFLGLFFATGWIGLIPPPQAQALEALGAQALDKALRPWKGDLNGMLQRRAVRVLVTYSKTNFFLDGPDKKGFVYETFQQFEKFLNQQYWKKGELPIHVKVHMVYVPVPRDRVFSCLNQGLGDIAAANLTITPERLKKVDFADPYYTKARELIVTGPSAPSIESVNDLSGKTVAVRKSSCYFESLTRLNREFSRKGRALVKIRPVNENLETEDILEMVNADLIQVTVADNYLANLWAKCFDNIQVHEDLALTSDTEIAWAIRKNSPQLKQELSRFVKKIKVGTLLGNVIANRYYRNTKWIQNVMSPQEIKRFNQTIDLFRRFGDQYGFDYLMLVALAYQESRLDQRKRSPQGAIGVMQLLPSTAAGHPVHIPDILKLDKNIHAGTKYLHFLYNTYYRNAPMDSLNKVLFTFAAYNAGAARINQLRKVAKSMGLNPDIWFRNVEVAAAREIGRETVQYVGNIFKYYIAYKQIAASMKERRRVKTQGIEKEP
ncbi:MAG: lytic transglycosylase F [Desulfatiglandaceae bacterium]